MFSGFTEDAIGEAVWCFAVDTDEVLIDFGIGFVALMFLDFLFSVVKEFLGIQG